MRANGIRNCNQILHGDQTILEEKFYRVDHVTCRAKMFDLIAVVRSVCGS